MELRLSTPGNASKVTDVLTSSVFHITLFMRYSLKYLHVHFLCRYGWTLGPKSSSLMPSAWAASLRWEVTMPTTITATSTMESPSELSAYVLTIYTLNSYVCESRCPSFTDSLSPSLPSHQRLHHAVLSQQWDQFFSRLCYLLCAGLHGLRAECPHRGCGRIWWANRTSDVNKTLLWTISVSLWISLNLPISGLS